MYKTFDVKVLFFFALNKEPVMLAKNIFANYWHEIPFFQKYIIVILLINWYGIVILYLQPKMNVLEKVFKMLYQVSWNISVIKSSLYQQHQHHHNHNSLI